MDPSEIAPRQREPVFQAPWPAVILPLALVAGFAAQTWLIPSAAVERLEVGRLALEQGRWETLVTAVFLHGSWGHVLMNAGFILAFGTPVARRMGANLAGAAGFLIFFVVCGVIGNLVFTGLDAHDAVLGASGAGSGLMAATSRLLTPGRRLAPFFSPPVLAMAGAFLLGNVIIAATGWAPGAGDAQVAWQAHLGGYAAGLVLFAPALALLRRL